MENPTALWISFFILITLYIFVYMIMISSNRKTKNYGSELGVRKAGKNITTIFYWILAFFILNTISYIVNLNIWENVSYENYESILEFAKVWSEIYNIIEFVIILVILINIKNAGYYLKNHDTSFKDKNRKIEEPFYGKLLK